MTKLRFTLIVLLTLRMSVPAGAATEKVLHNFINLPDGANPQSNLVADSAGNLYGTTYYGGEHQLGAVIRLSQAADGGWVERVIYSFSGTDGALPASALVLDSAGNLFGTTSRGGIQGANCDGCGVVFELTPGSNGKWSQTILHSFAGSDGSFPVASLIFDSQGNLYGTTEAGGPGSQGTVFELMHLSGGWQESILYAFYGGLDGSTPTAPLAFDTKGDIFSTTQYGGNVNCGGVGEAPGCGTVFELVPQSDGSWNESVLYSFSDDPAFLNNSTGLLIGPSGDLYGTTSGGTSPYGSVFRLRPTTDGNWAFEILYSFAGGSDGDAPSAGLTFNAGKLYGTTQYGGVLSTGVIPSLSTACPYTIGCGTVFELAPQLGGAWSERVIHSFSGAKDGSEPLASVIADPAGHLYVATLAGGGGGCDYLSKGCGAVVELSARTNGQWELTVLYQFAAKDGDSPQSTLIADSAGNLYGTTNIGGNGLGYLYGQGGEDCAYGCGTVFEMSPTLNSGWTRRILYNFTGVNGDGTFPSGNLTFDSAGNLYGATEFGGSSGWGAVFELMPYADGNWKEVVLYSFGGDSDGYYPLAGLVIDEGGNLYGTTEQGGAYRMGTVFKLSPSSSGTWTKTTLHGFSGANGDGSYPRSTLIFDASGNLYGTTEYGGSGECENYCGTVFELSPVSERSGSWRETVLYAFSGKNGDGAYPLGNVVFDAAGDLYGTTSEGGTASSCPNGDTCGTVFKLTRGIGGWTESIVYSFGSYSGDGTGPSGGLTLDGNGNMYGTTSGAVVGTGFAPGTVFKLAPSSEDGWTESIVHSFSGYPSDGGCPTANVTFDGKGNLYGTTSGGGAGDGEGVFCGFENWVPAGGTVFEISP